MKCTAERMYPDYISYDKVVEVTGDYKVSMGCRSFLAATEDGETAGRNNSVVSVNLLNCYQAGNIDLFFDLLELRVDTALKALEWRVDRLKYIQASCAHPLYVRSLWITLRA